MARIMSAQLPGPLGLSELSGRDCGVDVGTPLLPDFAVSETVRNTDGLRDLLEFGFDPFPVPPQKRLPDASGAPAARARPAVPLGFAVGGPLLFASPAIFGAITFIEGPPKRPNIKHDHGFLDDGNGNLDNSKRQAPTAEDFHEKERWSKIARGEIIQFSADFKDAADAYRHYLLDNDGKTLGIRYDGFLNDDASGKTVLQSAVDDIRTAVLDIFDTKFPQPPTAATSVSIRVTSVVMTVGASQIPPNLRYPYPATVNWQKKIGGHPLWVSGTATIESNPAGPRKVTIEMTMHIEDMYNFDPGKTDAQTSLPDDINGRFQVVGLATEFLQIGTATRTITFTVPNAKQSDNRVVPPDQKVTT
jgi:hypothetical protein